jgi:hypothetical protein
MVLINEFMSGEVFPRFQQHMGSQSKFIGFNPRGRARKMVEIYESFGGTYGLGRKNLVKANEDGSVGSPFLSFAIAINEALPKEFRRRTMGPEYARAIRRANQNSKKPIG